MLGYMHMHMRMRMHMLSGRDAKPPCGYPYYYANGSDWHRVLCGGRPDAVAVEEAHHLPPYAVTRSVGSGYRRVIGGSEEGYRKVWNLRASHARYTRTNVRARGPLLSSP